MEAGTTDWALKTAIASVKLYSSSRQVARRCWARIRAACEARAAAESSWLPSWASSSSTPISVEFKEVEAVFEDDDEEEEDDKEVEDQENSALMAVKRRSSSFASKFRATLRYYNRSQSEMTEEALLEPGGGGLSSPWDGLRSSAMLRSQQVEIRWFRGDGADFGAAFNVSPGLSSSSSSAALAFNDVSAATVKTWNEWQVADWALVQGFPDLYDTLVGLVRITFFACENIFFYRFLFFPLFHLLLLQKITGLRMLNLCHVGRALKLTGQANLAQARRLAFAIEKFRSKLLAKEKRRMARQQALLRAQLAQQHREAKQQAAAAAAAAKQQEQQQSTNERLK